MGITNFTALTRHNPSPSLFRKLFAGVIILSVLSFTSYMGVSAFLRASKNIEDLSHVSGEVTAATIIKHVQESKFETTIGDVLVLQIEGSDEKFGFPQGSDAFKALFGTNKVGKTVEIYYDPEGERIEEGVTLHTFDLKVGQGHIIDIEATKKGDRNLAIFFFALTVFLAVLIAVSVRQNRKERKAIHDSTHQKMAVGEV